MRGSSVLKYRQAVRILCLSRPLQAPEKAISTAEYFHPGKRTQIVVLLATAYLQIIFNFSTYVALAVCFVGVIISATILLGGSA